MIAAEVLDALVASGATAQMIAEAVKAAARADDQRRDRERVAAAERKRRSRARHRSRNVTVTERAVTMTAVTAPPNDIYSNPPLSPQSSEEDRPPSPDDLKKPQQEREPKLEERVVAAWNEGPAAAGASRSRGMNPRMRMSLRARLRDYGELALFEAIANLRASAFHCGTNDRDWRASLGWLLTSPDRFQRILELTKPPDNPATPANAAARAASVEESAAYFDKTGQADRAAEMRAVAARIRAQIPADGG